MSKYNDYLLPMASDKKSAFEETSKGAFFVSIAK